MNMDEAIIDDFKQFMTATITQQTSHLVSKDDIANMATKDDIARLERKINEIQLAVQHSAIDYTSVVDDQAQDHELRIKKLEQKIV